MKKILSFLLIFVTLFCLSSCGGGMSSEELYLSKAILLEDGSTEYILYNYYGDEIGRFQVPAPIKGEQGEPGNGILSIVPNPTEDGLGQVITVTLTDGTEIPFEVKNGISVVGVTEHFDDAGEKFILLEYSDGNTSETPIYLPKGEDGVSIDDFQYAYDEETNRIYLYISFSDPEKMEDIYYDFPAPEDGRGIEEMESYVGVDEEDGIEKYFIKVTYTDGETKTLKLTKPADPNKWYTSSEYISKELIPNAKTGDFYFDISMKEIWLKEASSWRCIVSFKTSENKYNITFNLNLDETAGQRASFVVGRDYYENILYGTYGVGKEDMPVPFSEGYNFIGWCSKPTQSQTAGFFTDLTPVYDNLVLYAIWEKIE